MPRTYRKLKKQNSLVSPYEQFDKDLADGMAALEKAFGALALDEEIDSADSVEAVADLYYARVVRRMMGRGFRMSGAAADTPSGVTLHTVKIVHEDPESIEHVGVAYHPIAALAIAAVSALVPEEMHLSQEQLLQHEEGIMEMLGFTLRDSGVLESPALPLLSAVESVIKRLKEGSVSPSEARELVDMLSGPYKDTKAKLLEAEGYTAPEIDLLLSNPASGVN